MWSRGTSAARLAIGSCLPIAAVQGGGRAAASCTPGRRAGGEPKARLLGAALGKHPIGQFVQAAQLGDACKLG